MCDKKKVCIELGGMVLELIMQSIMDHKTMFNTISEYEVDMVLARGHHLPKRCWFKTKNLLIELKFLVPQGKQNRGREFTVKGQIREP